MEVKPGTAAPIHQGTRPVTHTSPGPPDAGDEPLVLTVALGGRTVLRTVGTHTDMQRVLLAEQARLVAILAQALTAVTTKQPGPSPLVRALDAIEVFAELRDGDPPNDAFEDVRRSITEAHQTLLSAEERTIN